MSCLIFVFCDDRVPHRRKLFFPLHGSSFSLVARSLSCALRPCSTFLLLVSAMTHAQHVKRYSIPCGRLVWENNLWHSWAIMTHGDSRVAVTWQRICCPITELTCAGSGKKKSRFFCLSFFFAKQVKTVHLRCDVALTMFSSFPLFVVPVPLCNMVSAWCQWWKIIGVPRLADPSFEVQTLHSERIPSENVESISRSSWECRWSADAPDQHRRRNLSSWSLSALPTLRRAGPFMRSTTTSTAIQWHIRHKYTKDDSINKEDCDDGDDNDEKSTEPSWAVISSSLEYSLALSSRTPCRGCSTDSNKWFSVTSLHVNSKGVKRKRRGCQPPCCCSGDDDSRCGQGRILMCAIASDILDAMHVKSFCGTQCSSHCRQ